MADKPKITVEIDNSRRSMSASAGARSAKQPSATPSASTSTALQDDDDDELAIKPSGGGHGEGVFKILKRQANEGLEAQYIVQLDDGGKKVRRDESEVRRLAPNLLDGFLKQQAPAPPTTTTGETEIVLSDSETEAPKAKKPTRTVDKKVTSRGKKEAESDEDDDEASGGESMSGDERSDGSEDGSSESSSEDDVDESSDFDESGATSKRTRPTRAPKKVKSPKKGSRQSTRSTRVQKPLFDLGGGELDLDDEQDENESESESEGEFEDTSGGRGRRSTRARPSASGDDEPADDSADSRRAAREARKKTREDAIELESDDDVDQRQSELIQHAHYPNCSKCGDGPVPDIIARIQKVREKRKGGKRKAKRGDEFAEDSEQEEARVRTLGSWMNCVVCTSAYHYNCLPEYVRKAYVADANAQHNKLHPEPPAPEPVDGQPAPPAAAVPKRVRKELDIRQTFVVPKCGFCKRAGGRVCFVCGVSGRKVEPTIVAAAAAPAPAPEGEADAEAATGTDKMDVDYEPEPENPDAQIPALMFRCKKCKRCTHYTCMPADEKVAADYSTEAHVKSYLGDGQCHQCWTYTGQLDVILAWADDELLREQGQATAGDVDADDVRAEVETTLKKDDKTGRMVAIPSAKDPGACARYLVKWQGESYRQLEWVPHAYLQATYNAKLTGFLTRGSLVSFDPKPEGDEDEDGEEERVVVVGSAPMPDPDATSRIPAAWSTVDRVLDVWYRSRNGRQTVLHQNYRDLPEDPAESIKLVEECYFKWGDLPYSDSTKEAPPQEGDDGYDAYVKAYGRFLTANSPKMRVPNLNPKQLAELDKPRTIKGFTPIKVQPDFIVGGKLMPFQLEGVNFLFFQWWKRTGCILADEMGLGKTVQIITFLSLLNQKQGARPFLVAVPNSTMGNWVREFERWAPSMRVVPYGGDGPSRKIVEDYELFDPTGRTLKTHVVVATYEALEKNINVFKRVARWDCLVVDEGQRLKSGTDGLLFTALNSLNVNHRVLLSGTPLNNNITELFNLLHFIDPTQWGNIAELQAKYDTLTAEKVEEIRGILKPYFLRRTKELVLDLPPLNEIVVPVTMTSLQRQLYKSILERNAEALNSIYTKTSKSAVKSKSRKTSFNNILMELRKLLGHPYLVSPDLEPRDVTEVQAHANLRDASAKFILLSKLLPKLKAAGNRVLIFSQFKLTLNVLEDFLRGQNMRYLRLDGDTASLDRQRGIDAFQKEGSDVFCYLLSTRAGGVGINLTKADTVIMFDQDFNPHQDIQAISRAHRIGQKNPVRVFKLLVKGTCEERIFLAGTKKLGLDHLIIQRLDAEEEEANEVESILQYGAKAIFDDQEAEASAIRFTDNDIDSLLARTSGISPTSPKKDGAATFAHAKIWESARGLEDVTLGAEIEQQADDGDFWSNMLVQQEEAERLAKAATEANAGRGKRNRREVVYTMNQPRNKKAKGSATSADENGGARASDDSDDDFEVEIAADESGDDYEMQELDKDDFLGEKAPKAKREPKTGLTRPLVQLSAEELARRSNGKSQARIANIDSLARAAFVFQDSTVNRILSRARMATRPEQTLLIRQATSLINALCQQPYSGPGLTPLVPSKAPKEKRAPSNGASSSTSGDKA